MSGVVVQVVSRIPEIVAESTVKAGLAVQNTIQRIELGAKARSRVDTGQMRGGWMSHMTGAMSGVVENNVEHAIYNEFGTVKMSAQPMLAPSVEEARPMFIAEMNMVYG
jgi:HK97 gp10 family phage protein